VAKGDEIPESRHFGEIVGEEVLVQFLEQSLELLMHVLNRATMEEDEVEDLGALTHVLFPLGESASRTLSLRCQVFKQR